MLQSMEPEKTPSRTRWDRLIPGPADLVFAIVLGLVLVGGRYGLFGDPGTPWHLRLGREILASGSVPRHDFLTYTHQGASWVDQSWGFDVLLAAVVDARGWSAVVALTAGGLAGVYAAVGGGPVRGGGSPVASLLPAVLAVGVA